MQPRVVSSIAAASASLFLVVVPTTKAFALVGAHNRPIGAWQWVGIAMMSPMVAFASFGLARIALGLFYGQRATLRSGIWNVGLSFVGLNLCIAIALIVRSIG